MTSPHLEDFRSLWLFVFVLFNYALMYAANILLARLLTVSDFDDYSVAVSVVTMLSTLATLGLEKYALRAIALFRERQDWQRFRGFWLFSLRSITGLSVLLIILLSVGLETFLVSHHADYHIAIVVFAGFLPVIALTLFLVEVIAAQGAQLLSIAVYRVFLPIVYLLLLGSCVYFSPWPLSALSAVICLGSAWIVVLAVMRSIFNSVTPKEIKHSVPVVLGKKWLRRSLPLVMSSLLMTIMTSSGVVILDMLFTSGIEVGIYAVAAQTGGFITLIGTSTNRYYLPTMVLFINRADKQSMQQLIRQRALAVGTFILLMLGLIFFAGEMILGFFGDQFIAGYQTLVLIAVGASVSALFADASYLLQFMGVHRLVVMLKAFATFSMVLLGFVLGEKYGPVGVALAYMMATVTLFVGLRIIVSFRFQRLWRQNHEAPATK